MLFTTTNNKMNNLAEGLSYLKFSNIVDVISEPDRIVVETTSFLPLSSSTEIYMKDRGWEIENKANHYFDFVFPMT